LVLKRYLSSFFDKLKIVENGFVAARFLASATPFSTARNVEADGPLKQFPERQLEVEP
jgi:hypothetical protein